MAAENKTARLTDFAYDVLNSTTDAILTARMDQDRQYLEMVEDTLLSPEEFVDKYRLLDDLSASLDPAVSETERNRLLTEIYEQRQQSLARLFADGPPKLRVREGTIRIKLAFAVDAVQETREDPTAARMGEKRAFPPPEAALPRRRATDTATLKLDRAAKKRQLYHRENRSVTVLLPDPDQPVPQTGSAYGEIEIKFSVD